jgi:hypothetical protein
MNFSELLQKSKREVIKITHPNLGEVYLRSLSSKDRDTFERAYTENNTSGIRAVLVGLSLTDETGNRLVKDEELAQVGEMAWKDIDPLWTKALELNGLVATEGNTENPTDGTPN